LKSSLELLPVSSNVFIDPNRFLYHIMKHPKLFPSCKDFLTRIEAGEYNGFTSILAINEVLHKLMLAEAIKTYGLRSERDAIRLLKEKPEMISELSQVWKNYSDIKEYPVIVCDFDEEIMDKAVELSNRHGLLISDASHLAIMKDQGITNIATNDRDFERVEWIEVWKP
jgi:predicted nucleic acid-binding protein